MSLPQRQIRYEVEPYSYPEMRAIAKGLDLVEPVAIALVRRGHRTVEQARNFLAADERHPASAFAHIDAAVELIREAIEADVKITVHGDYDVDGICSTTILVSALRRAGAECDWLIPSRSDDGYGLSAETIEKLVERETAVLVTVDCGVNSVDEVRLAHEAGIEVVVTDHHQPGDELPDCPVIHPALGEYPFQDLCGAAVAWKLVEALEGSPRESDLDLVALATIADMVPLVGENRSLARAGMAELRRARRPGINALLAEAKVDPTHLDEGDIGFRLAPRLNAAGRLYRADAGVELMLSEDREAAAQIAAELTSANHQRREVERAVHAAAEAEMRSLPDDAREGAGIVLAGEGWHPGVVGIVASRMAERHGRPAILIALDESGKGKGSGRTAGGVDLLAALDQASEHLIRHGGHKAAAGLEIEADEIEGFRSAFASACERAMPDGAAAETERIDAIVGTDSLDLEVAEQLGKLGPFGQGNPDVRLLVPWARVGDVRPMGKDGVHARFSLKLGARPARGVAFNSRAALERTQADARDLTVKLELNHWNGSVEPRAVLAASHGLPPMEVSPDKDGEGLRAPCGCDRSLDSAWWRRFDEELSRPLPVSEPASNGRGTRERIRDHDRSPVAIISELVSSGARVLVVTADARRRSELASRAASPARFGAEHGIVCPDCADGRYASLLDAGAALVLSDWDSLVGAEGGADGFNHVVVVDPPRTAAERAWVDASGEGFLHTAWSGGSNELAEGGWDRSWELRADLAEIYRAASSGLDPELVFGGEGSYRRSPLIAARCVRVLVELGLVSLGGDGDTRSLRVVSSTETDLQQSEACRAYRDHHREGQAFLQIQRAES